MQKRIKCECGREYFVWLEGSTLHVEQVQSKKRKPLLVQKTKNQVENRTLEDFRQPGGAQN